MDRTVQVQGDKSGFATLEKIRSGSRRGVVYVRAIPSDGGLAEKYAANRQGVPCGQKPAMDVYFRAIRLRENPYLHRYGSTSTESGRKNAVYAVDNCCAGIAGGDIRRGYLQCADCTAENNESAIHRRSFQNAGQYAAIGQRLPAGV